jgi:hypothetical protein
MNQIIIKCVCTTSAFFASIQGFACRSLEPFQDSDKAKAKTVFEGEQAAAVQGVCGPPYLISQTGKGTNCVP